VTWATIDVVKEHEASRGYDTHPIGMTNRTSERRDHTVDRSDETS
jgi:hypothetical protein